MTANFRYRRISYIALDVTDLARSTEFYCDLVGLTLAREDAGASYLTCSDLPQNLVLQRGDTAGLQRAAFELESRDDLERAFEYLTIERLAPEWVGSDELARLRLGKALRVRVPGCGLLFEMHVEPDLADIPFTPGHTDIARLGHVVLNVADFDEVARALARLNFLVSDHVPGKVEFLRAFPSPYHHSLAILKGPRDGYNHVNFMVDDIDDIGRALNRMKRADVPIVFGPGRHLPSGSIFLYFLDPDGMTAEYSVGMEEFGEEGARDPRVLDPTPEVLDTWGSVPDPRFGQAGAIITHD